MIITVTMNPAIDKTISVENFEVGTLNRISSSVIDVGGKGINVSKTIANAIHGKTLATGFIGGSTGDMIEKVLNETGIKTDFVRVKGETRTNTKVFSQNYPVTELNEQGEIITCEQLAALTEKILSYANKETLFVLAGSIPKGVPKDIYHTITVLVKEKGSKVVLDADGELFKNSLSALPNIIKPNREELAQYAGLNEKPTLTQIVEIAKEFIQMGIETVAVSMGKDGSVFINKEKALICPEVPVKVLSTVGAGDAMVAGIAYSTHENLSFEEMIKLSASTSTGAVTTVGTKPPSYELVQDLIKQVVINEF
ncbi:MAG: 1-phosphofructokinase [Clostridia bacterium]